MSKKLTENEVGVLMNLVRAAEAMAAIMQPDRTLELELRAINEKLDDLETEDAEDED